MNILNFGSFVPVSVSAMLHIENRYLVFLAAGPQLAHTSFVSNAFMSSPVWEVFHAMTYDHRGTLGSPFFFQFIYSNPSLFSGDWAPKNLGETISCYLWTPKLTPWNEIATTVHSAENGPIVCLFGTCKSNRNKQRVLSHYLLLCEKLCCVDNARAYCHHRSYPILWLVKIEVFGTWRGKKSIHIPTSHTAIEKWSNRFCYKKIQGHKILPMFLSFDHFYYF